MKFNLLFYFIFLIGFNALAMEHEVSDNKSVPFVQDLQILALEQAQQLTPHTQEQQLENLLQKYPHVDIHYYRFLMQKPNEEMIASEVHMRSFLAYFLKNNDYFDSAKIPFETVFNTFFDVYITDGFEQPSTIYSDKERFKNLINHVLDEERAHKDDFTFYHAMHNHYAFIMDILTELRSQITGQQTINYRDIWENTSTNASPYMIIIEKLKTNNLNRKG